MSVNHTFKGVSLTTVKTMIAQCDQSETECDGCTRLVSHNLCLLNIPHRVMCGEVIIEDRVAFFPDESAMVGHHWWVELFNDQGAVWYIDFRLRQMMTGVPDLDPETLPHGMFRPFLEFTKATYEPHTEFPGALLPQSMYRLLQHPDTIPGLQESIAMLRDRMNSTQLNDTVWHEN